MGSGKSQPSRSEGHGQVRRESAWDENRRRAEAGQTRRDAGRRPAGLLRGLTVGRSVRGAN